jgi:hypothetical protein
MDELLENQDFPQPKDFNRRRVEELLKTWREE